MLKRTVVSLLLCPLLLVPLFAPVWVLTLCISAVSALAVWELLGAVKPANKRLTVYAVIFAMAVPVYYYAEFHVSLTTYLSELYVYDVSIALPQAGILLFIILLFLEAVINYGKVSFSQIGMVFTAALVIPFFFSSLIRIMPFEGRGDRAVMLLPFIAAFAGDIFAYFTGRAFGKRKLTPVSPNKTVAGAIGGLIGVLSVMIVFGLILVWTRDGDFYWFNWIFFLLCAGLFGGIAAQIGDLAMSLIKREYGVKDFGKILPGHGGTLDRFDSLLFAAPAVEVTFWFYWMIV